MSETSSGGSQERGSLSHLDADGRARMVDVSAKAVTTRAATATGEFVTTAAVVALVRADDLPKADVLATARIAGISGAKRTSELIPLCHQIALSSVNIDFDLRESSIGITATAKTKGTTGVEMEALTAVAIAGLTLHDMVKAVDPAARLTNIELQHKSGGKRGVWSRESARSPSAISTADPIADSVVVVASTSTAAGTSTDTTGPVIADWLAQQGFTVRGPLVYADSDIAAGLADALSGEPKVVITTGGTGVSPSDQTPEATRAVVERELPGIAEAIRAKGIAGFPLAALSRAVVGVRGRTLIVNLPGSTGGVRDGLAVLEPLLAHLVAQVVGEGRHD